MGSDHFASNASFLLEYHSNCNPRAVVSEKKFPTQLQGKLAPVEWSQFIAECETVGKNMDSLIKTQLRNRFCMTVFTAIGALGGAVGGFFVGFLGYTKGKSGMVHAGIILGVICVISIIVLVCKPSQKIPLAKWQKTTEDILREKCLKMQSQFGMLLTVKGETKRTRIVFAPVRQGVIVTSPLSKHSGEGVAKHSGEGVAKHSGTTPHSPGASTRQLHGTHRAHGAHGTHGAHGADGSLGAHDADGTHGTHATHNSHTSTEMATKRRKARRQVTPDPLSLEEVVVDPAFAAPLPPPGPPLPHDAPPHHGGSDRGSDYY